MHLGLGIARRQPNALEAHLIEHRSGADFTGPPRFGNRRDKDRTVARLAEPRWTGLRIDGWKLEVKQAH